MGTLKDAQRTLAIMACIVLIGALLIVLFAPSAEAQTAVKYHQKLQKENSFETRLKANKSFTLVSAKANLKTARKNARKDRKEERKLAKVRAKREQVAKIKP